MAEHPLEPFGWKTMWVIAMFDLPVETPQNRRAYARFRKDLLEDGFAMMQFSVYHRHCGSPESAHAHVQKMGKLLPPEGEVRFVTITDKQFGNIVSFWGKKRKPPESTPTQLEFF